MTNIYFKKHDLIGIQDKERDGAIEEGMELRELEFYIEKPIYELILHPQKFLHIGGSLAMKLQHGFENKVQKALAKGYDSTEAGLSSLGIAYSCKKGVKPSPNQDDFFLLLDHKTYIFAIFDGHGNSGHYCSNFVQQMLPKLLLSNPNYATNLELAMSQSFTTTHRALVALCDKKNKFSCYLSGTTATVAVLQGDHLLIGHVGDSRGVKGRISKIGEIEADIITRDHSPALPDEQERINSSNGEVRKSDQKGPWRVFLRDENYPGLAMTRAIGDSVGKDIGIICEPEIKSYILGKDDLFLVICSDGVWEFLSSLQAVQIIAQKGRHRVKQACELLAETAFNKWLENEGTSVDDITVICAYFN